MKKGRFAKAGSSHREVPLRGRDVLVISHCVQHRHLLISSSYIWQESKSKKSHWCTFKIGFQNIFLSIILKKHMEVGLPRKALPDHQPDVSASGAVGRGLGQGRSSWLPFSAASWEWGKCLGEVSYPICFLLYSPGTGQEPSHRNCSSQLPNPTGRARHWKAL